MKMFKCLSLVSLFLLVLSSCGDKTTTDGTLIKGRVTIEGYEGRYVHLEIGDGIVADSSLVDGGRFSFTLSDSLPQVYELVLKTSDDDIFPIILPVVSEKGTVSASLGEYVLTTGTPLNDKLQDFLLAVSNLSEKSLESGEMDLEKYKSDLASLIEGHSFHNSGNVLGKYLLEKYGSKLNSEQLERIRMKISN